MAKKKRKAVGGATDEAAAHERSANQRGRADWALYAEHRAQLMGAILRASPKPGGRVALLGSGNCNDVDLAVLAGHFREITLVDLDRDAVASARSRLPEQVQAKIKVHAPLHLSGLLPTLRSRATTQVPTFQEIDTWAALGSQGVVAALAGPFDLVVSCCVLTQLSWTLSRILSPSHPMLTHAREALVAEHLRTLVGLAGDGSALLACDMISSEYYPLDGLPPDTDLTALMQALIAAQNYYQGANPVLVRRLLASDPHLLASGKTAEWLTPWLWQGPLERTYLVYAVALSLPVANVI